MSSRRFCCAGVRWPAVLLCMLDSGFGLCYLPWVSCDDRLKWYLCVWCVCWAIASMICFSTGGGWLAVLSRVVDTIHGGCQRTCTPINDYAPFRFKCVWKLCMHVRVIVDNFTHVLHCSEAMAGRVVGCAGQRLWPCYRAWVSFDDHSTFRCNRVCCGFQTQWLCSVCCRLSTPRSDVYSGTVCVPRSTGNRNCALDAF
jgi:hypothetical protein